MKLTALAAESQRTIYNNVAHATGLPPISIEKDWWVTQVLKAVFQLPYREHLSFKGGTSLSKCWGLIERFSEDIDLGIDREFLGFEGNLSKTQISDKLRRAACSFVRESMQHDLREALVTIGLEEEIFEVKVDITPITTTDPEVIRVAYRSIYPELNDPYLPPVVKIEASGRSMSEPIQEKTIESIVDKAVPQSVVREALFDVRAVLPERTFLEKMFLLHEEFSKPQVRVERMSRHVYDLAQMMSRGIHQRALADETLYRQVLEHRREFIGLKNFDYDMLYPEHLNIIPSDATRELWRKDYEQMQQHMIWSTDSPSYEILLTRLSELNNMVKRLNYR
ncbi:MAG: nucleotidyl transferase AbiEii/AbiGii toxin family protein [Bacteroidales bacterium]|nr:nucleotidyl transferase AbiEii/AbiGii toxin family protein [Bacteroidales bacterium]